MAAVAACDDREALGRAVDYYYATHEAGRRSATDLDLAGARELLRTLCGEAVNRDFIQYLTRGAWGTSSSEMLRILHGSGRGRYGAARRAAPRYAGQSLTPFGRWLMKTKVPTDFGGPQASFESLALKT